MPQVIATGRGYIDGAIKEPGDKFEVSDAVLKAGGGEILEVLKDGTVKRTGEFRPCSWFKAVSAEKAPKKGDAKKPAEGEQSLV